MFFFLFLCLYFRAKSLVILLFAFVLFSEIRSSQCSPGWSQIHHPPASFFSLPHWDYRLGTPSPVLQIHCITISAKFKTKIALLLFGWDSSQLVD